MALAAIAAAATVSIVVVMAPGVRAQIARTIRIVVPYDIVARLMADQAGRTSGPAMIVENQPGEGGAGGTETVARATPDGTTLLVVSTPFLIDPLLRKLNYDPLRSFAPICNLVSALTIIVVNSARALAVGNRTRAEPLPDVPTVIESGYDDFDIAAWFGAFAPAFTPEPAINEVKHLFTTALQDSSVKEKLYRFRVCFQL